MVEKRRNVRYKKVIVSSVKHSGAVSVKAEIAPQRLVSMNCAIRDEKMSLLYVKLNSMRR